MNYVAVALLGACLGQPPSASATADCYPLNSRNIKLPIRYEKDRKAIRMVKLFVAKNGENTWYQEAAAAPDRESFSYTAKEDGIYWFTMVEEDLQGKNNPADLTRTPPDLKVLVDTVQPRVQFTNARRTGNEIVIEWQIDDKYPDEAKSQVHFRASGTDGYWLEVTLPAESRSGVRFPVNIAGAVSIRVTAFDLAGNKTEMVHEVGGTGATSATRTSLSPPPAPPPPDAVAGVNMAPLPPPDLEPLAPTAPTMPTPETNSRIVAAPQMQNPAHSEMHAPQPPAPSHTIATVPPTRTETTLPTGPAESELTPVAVWTGASNPSGPTVELTRAQFINYYSFDMSYEVESRGPSGISRLDVWATRDDGRTWLKWSQHDGKAQTVRVKLDVPGNPMPEGAYGFRVVPVSGAGLSERAPVNGDAPDLRVVLDVTPPALDLYAPTGDPSSLDTLVIKWKAADKNFGEDPITIEWSDKPVGPWQPAAAGGEVMQVGAGAIAQSRRLPNTGQFSWRVPAGLPPRVFLKVSARDAAGNVKEVVTRDPILVDLVKPRAKISGIVEPAGGVVRP